MRAILCKTWCEFEDLTIEDVPEPELKPGSARIAVKAAGVSYGQSLLVAGKYQRKPALPFVPGVEIAGEVIECAPGIKRCKSGDRVAALLDPLVTRYDLTDFAEAMGIIRDRKAIGKVVLIP